MDGRAKPLMDRKVLEVSSLSLCFSDYLPIPTYLSVYLSIYLSLFHLITYLPVYLSIYLILSYLIQSNPIQSNLI